MTYDTPAAFRAGRIFLGLSQTQLARVLRFAGPGAVSRIENGHTKPSAQTQALLEAFIEGYRPRNWPTKTQPTKETTQ